METTNIPTLQDFHIEGVRHINPAEALEALQHNEAVLVDVREQNEVSLGNVPLDRVLYHPMSVILDRLPFIAKDQKLIIGCTKGERSVKVANLLNLQGYPNVANLDGGFKVWEVKGFPYENILPQSCGGGCSCGSNGSSCC